MTEALIHRWMLWGFLALAVATLPVLFLVPAPYGRHAPEGSGGVRSKIGWIVMEAPSALVVLACWAAGEHRSDPGRIALLALWELHYLNRAFVFPFQRRGGERRMPWGIVAGAFAFTSINGYLNGRWLFSFAPPEAYGAAWLADPRFVTGALLFLVGFAINQSADRVLFRLRVPGETGYKIPQGGLYRFVSCPNYLGEIVEWCGFALCSFSLPGLVFAVWTIANLVPRAVMHHRWYRSTFPDYPAERRAIVPFVL
jgi:3-oxo-5-alpha-steroid 4-dehydrogenase 1